MLNKKKILKVLGITILGIGVLITSNLFIFNGREKALDNKRQEVNKVKEENEILSKELTNKETLINSKEIEINKKVEEVNKEKESLNKLEKTLRDKEEELKNKEETLKKNETDFNKWHYVSDNLAIKLEEKTLNTPAKYWVATIKTKSPNQLKTTFGSDTYGGRREGVSSMAKRNGGIVGINANGFSFTSNKPVGGPIVRNGKVYEDGVVTPNTMCVMKDGSFYSPDRNTSVSELINKGLLHTFNWSPVLIKDGKKMPYTDGKPTGYYARSAIGQVSPTEYVMIVADGKRSNYSIGLKIEQLQEEFAKRGCKYAYNMDGGGSATMYFNGRVVNSPSDGYERPVADSIFFSN